MNTIKKRTGSLTAKLAAALLAFAGVVTAWGADPVTIQDADGNDISVYEVSSGFYQNGAKYDSTTDFYITSKAGLEYFRDLVNQVGTVADTYVSTFDTDTAANWYTENIFTGKTVHLMTDVDLENAEWSPIGQPKNAAGDKRCFYGNFDGEGHKISNLKATTYTEAIKTWYPGLFGTVSGTQTFSNLTIENVTLVGYDYAGAIVGNAGSNATAFNNCHVTGKIDIKCTMVDAFVGGIVGIGTSAIDDCSVEGTAGSTIEGSTVGGLAGTSTRTAKDNANTVTDSTVTGVTVKSDDNGGQAGGLVGKATNPVTVTGNTVHDVTVSAEAGKADVLVGGVGGDVTASSNTTDTNVTVISDPITGSGTQADPYIIANIDALKAFRDRVNAGNTYSGKFIKLTSNIDLNNEEWEPIGIYSYRTKADGSGQTISPQKPFCGTFDGDGHTISNLKMTVADGSSKAYQGAGLFGYTTAPAAIKNLNIRNAEVQGRLYVGALVGNAYTGQLIDNCHVSGVIKIEGSWYVGGLCGQGYMNKVTNCSVVGDVGSGSYVRGRSVVDDMYADDSSGYIGGIWGFRGEGGNVIADCTVKNISVQGQWNGTGGICGIAHYGNIVSNCTVEAMSVTALEDENNCGLIAGSDLSSAASSAKVLDCTVAEGATASAGTGASQREVTTQVGAANNNGVATTPANSALVGFDVIYDESGKVTGGTFEKIPDAIIAEGFEAVADSETGLYTLKHYVAQVGDQKFETLAEAIAAAKDGDTVKMLADTEIESGISVAKDITLDLNGKTIAYTSSEKTYVFTVTDGEMIVTDTAENGKIAASNNGRAFLLNGGSLSVEGGTLSAAGFAIRNDGEGTVAINGGTVIVSGSSAIYNNGIGTVEISGGTVSATGSYTVNNRANGTVVISAGTVTAGNQQAVLNNGMGAVEISGGEISAVYYAVLNSSVGEVEISGGEISAESVGAVWNKGDGTVKISGGEISASEAAVWNAASKENTGVVNITGGTLTANNKAVYSAGGTVNISGGTLVATYDTISNQDGYVKVGGTAVLRSTMDPSRSIYSGGTAGNNGSLDRFEINGGSIDGVIEFSSTTGTYSITGGIFSVEPTKGVAEGYSVVSNPDPATNEVYPYAILSDYEAQIVRNGAVVTPKGTLAEMVAAAQSGDTIKLLKDVALTTPISAFGRSNLYSLAITKSLTIDGQGLYTITSSVLRGIGIGGNGSKINVTFKDVTLISSNSSQGMCLETRGDIGTITLDNATINASGSEVAGLQVGGSQYDAANIVVTNSTFNMAVDGYPIVTWNIVNVSIIDSEMSGHCAMYMKGITGSSGSGGSVVDVKRTVITSKSNKGFAFGAFVFERFEGGNDNTVITMADSTVNLMSLVNGTYQNLIFCDPNFGNVYGNRLVLLSGNKIWAEGQAITLLYPQDGTSVALDIADDTLVGGDSYGKVKLEAALVPFGYTLGDTVSDGARTYYRLAKMAAKIEVGNDTTYYSTFTDAIAAAETYKTANGVYPTITVLDATAEQTNPDWKIADGKLVRKTYVAQIDTTKYETLAEALSNAQDFDTVVLIADAVLPSPFIFNAEKEITLDLAGHAITSTADDLLKVQSGALTVNDSVGGGSVFTDNWTVFCVAGGEVVVNGGKFGATQHNTVYVSEGGITFNGGMVDMGVDSVGEYSGEDVQAYEGLGENAGYTIFVVPLVSDIDPPIYETTAVGVSSTVQLDAYYGAGATLTWSSSDTSIATVDSTGRVTFTGTAGTATIYAVAQNGSYATAMVAVGTATVKNMTTGTEYVMLQTAIDTASAGDTLKLIANVSLTDAAYVPDTAEIVIDLDGHDIVNTRTGVTSAQYAIYNDGTLTIKDSKDDGTTGGHVYTTNIETSGNEAVLNYGTLVIEGGWFGDSDCNKTNANIINAGRAVTTYGTATLNGGHYTAIDNFTNGKYTYALFSNGSAASLTINAADIYGTMNGVISSSNGGLLTVNDATIVFGRMDFDTYPYRLAYGYYGNIVINGGTWKTQAKVRADDSQEFCDWYKSDAITITGGKFDLQDWNDVYGIAKISGGIFNKVVPAKNLATGCICTDNLDPETKVTYPYTVGTPVAQIGDVKYVTFAAAIDAAQDGQTVKLLKNCSGSGIIVPQGKFAASGLTVDFGGFTYTVDSDPLAGSAGTKTQAFQLLKDNTITFKNGAIVADNANVKMLIQNYSNLTLDNMTLDATQGGNSVGYVLSTNNGSTTIKDTTITAKTGGVAFDVDSGWGNYAANSVEVVGGSVINGNVEVAFENRTPGTPSTLTLTSGTLNGEINVGAGFDDCTVRKADTFTQTAPEGYEWIASGTAGVQTLNKIPVITAAATGAAVLSTDLPSGYSLKRSVDGGDWTEVQSTGIALDDLPGSGAAKTYEFKAVKGGSEIAIANKVGILHVADTVTNETTVIAVPWLAFGEKITIDSLVYLGNRSEGDQLMAYDADNDSYYTWTLVKNAGTGALEWTAGSTVKAGSEPAVAPAASEFEVVRGQGVFLTRTDTTKPIYLVGRVAEDGETVAAAVTTLAAGSAKAPGWTLVAAPSTTDLDLNASASPFGSDNKSDTIVLVTSGAGLKIPCTYSGGEWGRPVSKKIEGTDYYYTERDTANCKIPAGTGFWYLNKGGAKTVEWGK